MEFSPQSRVWIYQSDRELNRVETEQIQKQLNQFAAIWTAHNNQLKAVGEIRFNRFLILIVDEMDAGASGCSIDKSVKFMKNLEQEYGLNIFDRFQIAYREKDDIVGVDRNTFENLLREGKIHQETLVFNNLVPTLSELQENWEIPLKNSWHARFFNHLIQT